MPTHCPRYECRNLLLILFFVLPVFSLAQTPENDDPCPTDSNPPIDLTSTGSHTGTTCEATFDYINVDCSADTELASVWYTYTPNSTDDGYDISLSSAGGGNDAEGPITMELYKGTTNQGCSGFSTTLEVSCSSINSNISIPNNFAAGEILYIKVTTDVASENCGEFMISVEIGDCGEFADNCSDITSAQTLNPVTLDYFELNYHCAFGCIDYANPDPSATGGCAEFADNPTVWFKINVDDDAQQLYSTVVPNGNWDAVWSIYGGDDCSNLQIISSEGQTCSNGDVTPELFQIGVEAIYESYWLAVTVDPTSVPITGIDDGSFDICVSTVINGIVCLGSLEGDCAEPSLVIEVTERELEGQSLDGPFCPGEEVSIHVSFFFDASETSSDWLSGIIPRFGPGWNLEGFDYNAMAPVGNGSTAEWLEEDGPCAPAISEAVPHLCTYVDEDGNLKLCNNLCESCDECPIQGMQEEDPLPSGYFWVTNGGSAGCDNDCSPQEGWGIGAVTVQVEWDFTLKVKDYVDYETCFENNDLQISFQSFSQGVVGCWEDPIGECLIDKSQFGPLWKVDCIIPPGVEAEDAEVCHGSTTDIPVFTQNGEANTIIVEVEDNPFVDGEMNHTFPGGSGNIQDVLINFSGQVQTVTYKLYAEDPGLTCPAPITEIAVTVYPAMLNDEDDVYVCEGDCTYLVPVIDGGAGGPYSYQWITGETDHEIMVCPVVPTTYTVTVTDLVGCSAVFEMTVDVIPTVEIELPSSINVCKDDDFDLSDPDYMVCLDIFNGNPPYNIDWNAPPGLEGVSGGIFGECFIINETTSSEFAGDEGEYILSVSVTDDFWCQAEAEITVKVTGEIVLVLDVADMECGDTEASISATAFDATGNPVTSFILYGGCPMDGSLGDFLEEGSPSTGLYTFPPQDLLSYTCYSVIAQTDEGCQVRQDITIPISEGPPIEISGTANVCAGEEAMIWIENAEDYISFEWTPDIGSSDSLSFIPDSTFTYFVEAFDATGCMSQEVFTVTVFDADSPACADPCENQMTDYQITGFAYSDDNANGIFDEGELPLSNVQITDVENDFTVFTNVFGVYAIPVNAGEVNLSAKNNQGQWTNPEIDKTVEVELPCEEGINFGFIPFGTNADVQIYMMNTITRCDWEVRFTITVINENHQTFNGRIEFAFDDKTSFFSSPIEDIQVINHVASFDTGPVPGFVPQVYEITLKMPGGTANLPMLDFSVNIFNGENLLDTYAYSEQLRCSYDPNDKRTFPDRPGPDNPTLKEEQLDYTIRFQNNGNDTAFHVRIVDVLDPNIIKNSIRFIASSHPYDACISGDSLIIDFANIMLVDSMTNYDASQGFISFICEIDPNVELDTEILNTADIIFDTNPPIVTNTTINTIVDMLCVNTTMDVSQTICQGEEFMGFDATGNYEIDLISQFGCDSIIHLELEVISPQTTDLGETDVCEGESLVIEGIEIEIDSSRRYEIEIEGNSGCIEQIFSVDVEVISTEEIFEAFTICDGDIIDYGGDQYEIDESGVYEFNIFNEGGCLTHLLIFDVTVISVEQNLLEFQICKDEIVIYEDEEYTFDTSGIYSYIIQGPSGCDEVELVFDISIYQTMYSELDTTICEGQSYEGLEESGIYTFESEDPVTGCPSFETVNLTVLPTSDPECITSAKDEILDQIEVFPIPASDILYVKSEVAIQKLIVLSTTGQILLKADMSHVKEPKLDISGLSEGFHLLMVETIQGRVIKKVVINR